MGSFFAVFSGSSRRSTYDKTVVKDVPPVHDDDRPFTEMLKDNPHYGEWSNADKIVYDVNLVHCQLHWKLLVKKTNSKRLPFITFEIRTDNLNRLIPWQDTFSVSSVHSSYVGTYVGTLNRFAQMADATVEKMQHYDLLTSNCQVFCNEMLKKVNLPEFEPTYRPDMLDTAFDQITEDLMMDVKGKATTTINTRQVAPTSSMAVPSAPSNSEVNGKGSNSGAMPSCGASMNSTRISCGSTPMSMTKRELKKTVPVPSVSDLNVLRKKFIPIKDDWMGIGSLLSLDPSTLQDIKNVDKKPEACLREMLRIYLQKRNPQPMWQELIQAAEVYSLAVANSIALRAECIRA